MCCSSDQAIVQLSIVILVIRLIVTITQGAAVERIVNATEARKHLGQLLEEVRYQRRRVIIERAGLPMAVLVPLEQYEQWRAQRQASFAMVDEVQQRTRSTPAESLEATIAEAVAAARVPERAGDER